MNGIFIKYLLSNFLKVVLTVSLIAYSLGIILNLFEEIEFFKDTGKNLYYPLMLTALFIPNQIIKLFPFIIFISSMWFFLNIKNNKDLLSLKIYGFSNFKIFLIISSSAFFLGWLILFAINPVTSVMIKSYEEIKSNYSRDIDHLVSVNKNGLWIRENLDEDTRVITAEKFEKNKISNIQVFTLDKNNLLISRVDSKEANINNKMWVFKDAKVYSSLNSYKPVFLKNYTLISKYDYKKIVNLFKNFDTISFISLIIDKEKLIDKGYNSSLLTQNLNSKLSLPFFLFVMVALGAILTLGNMKKVSNLNYIILGIIVCVAIYFLKDLSVALGEIGKLPILISIWVPIIATGLFCSIGILQINEK